MGNNPIEKTAERALRGALQRGIKDVRVVIYRARSVSVTYRQGQPDRVLESSKQSLTLNLYLNGQFTSCETNDLRDGAVDLFLDSSTALCKAMARDPFREITDPQLYADRPTVDLKLFDASIDAVTPGERRDSAAALEAAVVEGAKARLISAEASYEDAQSELYQLHSNGFEGRKRGTTFWMVSEVSLQDEGDKRPSGWGQGGARHRVDLPQIESVGQSTVETAEARLGARQIETAKLPMIIESRAVGRLLGQLLGAASGRALQQKASFLEGRIGQQIGGPMLTLLDDPFVVGGFGSRLFDGEGISAKRLPIFENGVLKNVYLDTYYGKKLGLAPTTGGRSNLLMPTGDKDLAGLMAEVQDGVLVRGFVGGNANPTTGDFSLGVYGTRFEHGQPTHAVAQMNIAGNHNDLWQRLIAVGNDPYPYTSLRVPSLVFDGVQFSGI